LKTLIAGNPVETCREMILFSGFPCHAIPFLLLSLGYQAIERTQMMARILIVDDDPDISFMLKHLLSKAHKSRRSFDCHK